MSARVPRRALPALVFITMLGLGVAGLRVSAVGTTRYVSRVTCPQIGSGTQANPYCWIQDAICNAVSGDTVSVAPGTYPEAIRVRPGVSVISQGGAAQTTINSSNQPCTDNDFCVKRAGNQCTVVTFPSGHTPSTVLDGFTITGGAGLVQSSGGVNKVAGGGIYVFSAPTIMNNVITNNVLSGPAPHNGDMRGAGVYVGVGAPLITNNTITGNRVVPPAGSSSLPSFGYGGGVWLSAFSDAVLVNNIIAGNVAGDPNVAFSLGAGGGILAWPPQPSLTAGQRIDRNMIADNQSDNTGGGVALLSDPNTGSFTAVTNNVIVGNTARSGGGVYQYYSSVKVVNNTITANEAMLGGGISLGQGETALPVSVTNNIIEGNTLRAFGNGGGIYKLDFSATFEPTISFNDLWNNEVNNVAGDRTDADTIGVNGNFSLDPRFVNRPARDFHLDPNSPAIDRASAVAAPPVDKDNLPRGVDGNGIPNNPVTGDVDVGAYERHAGCAGSTEICDGQDNDCDTQVDEGFLNTDGDALANCVDPDDDNDVALDGADCAPVDPTAFGQALEVSGLDVSVAAPTTVPFNTQAIGSGTHYEALAGLMSRVRATGGFQEMFCASASVTTSPWMDGRPAPPVGDAWFYLMRGVNACGQGTLGTSLRDQGGAGDACALGIVDGDADGSPSDLDCDDTSAGRSPLVPEVCDNFDQDCDLVADDGNPGGGQACGSSVGTCQPGVTTCTGGSLSCQGGVGPGPELCDGLDNDCDGTPDDNVVDTDQDGQNDCIDTNDDNDAAPDASDCAPLNSGAFGIPFEVDGLDVQAGSPTPIVWTNQTIGTATVYDLVTGNITQAGTLSYPAGSCLGTDAGSPFLDPLGTPPAGQSRYYLVRSRNVCGASTYGSAARDTSPACP